MSGNPVLAWPNDDGESPPGGWQGSQAPKRGGRRGRRQGHAPVLGQAAALRAVRVGRAGGDELDVPVLARARETVAVTRLVHEAERPGLGHEAHGAPARREHGLAPLAGVVVHRAGAARAVRGRGADRVREGGRNQEDPRRSQLRPRVTRRRDGKGLTAWRTPAPSTSRPNGRGREDERARAVGQRRASPAGSPSRGTPATPSAPRAPSRRCSRCGCSGTAGWRPELEDLPPVCQPLSAPLRVALSNSFGFGGTNVSLVLGALG